MARRVVLIAGAVAGLGVLVLIAHFVWDTLRPRAGGDVVAHYQERGLVGQAADEGGKAPKRWLLFSPDGQVTALLMEFGTERDAAVYPDGGVSFDRFRLLPSPLGSPASQEFVLRLHQSRP